MFPHIQRNLPLMAKQQLDLGVHSHWITLDTQSPLSDKLYCNNHYSLQSLSHLLCLYRQSAHNQKFVSLDLIDLGYMPLSELDIEDRHHQLY